MIPKIFLRRISCVTIVCLALAGYSPNAISWGAHVHTAIGILAVEQLQPETLLILEDIISPLTRQAMAEACNWPDVIRETEEGKWGGSLHYVNIPRGDEVYTSLRDCPEQPGPSERPTQHCATEAIKFFATGLVNPQASKEQRWQSFAWLCQLVGDLHQPLHTGYADDRGGNDVNVVFNGEAMNLHHFWDFALANQRAGSWQYLVGELSEFPPVRAASGWSPEMVDDWTNESHKLAGESVYPANPEIDEVYAQQSWELIQKQIRLAASRLALIINSELQP
ncbi:MAG TPA: S1/P1 nuclease [Xanthomonadales bacterium]